MRKILTMAILAMATVSASAATKEEVANVVMLGDSTMLSKHAPEGKKLRDFVQKELDKLHRRKKPRIAVINSGKGGEMATAGLDRIAADVLAHKPSVVTVSYGLNDTNVLNSEQFKQAMARIVAAIRKGSNAKIILLTSTPFDNERHMWGKQYAARGGLDEYMDKTICSMTRELANEQELSLCDLHEAFKQDPRPAEYIRADGVHLTAEGNRAAARILAPIIHAELTGKGSPRH